MSRRLTEMMDRAEDVLIGQSDSKAAAQLAREWGCNRSFARRIIRRVYRRWKVEASEGGRAEKKQLISQRLDALLTAAMTKSKPRFHAGSGELVLVPDPNINAAKSVIELQARLAGLLDEDAPRDGDDPGSLDSVNIFRRLYGLDAYSPEEFEAMRTGDVPDPEPEDDGET